MAVAVTAWSQAIINPITGELLTPGTAVTVTNIDNSNPTTTTPAGMFSDYTGTATAGSNVQNTDSVGNLTIYVKPAGSDGSSRYKLSAAGLGTIVIFVAPVDSDLIHRTGPTAPKIDFTSPIFGGASGSDWSPAIAVVASVMGSAPYILTAPALPAGSSYNISANHQVGNGQGIQCAGSGQIFSSVPAVVFTCTASGAGIVIAGTGPPCEGFRVDGNGVANKPLQVGTLASAGDGRVLIDVVAVNSAQDSFTVLYCQNHLFLGCAAYGSAQDNLVVSGSCGGASFVRFEGASPGRHNCRVDASVDGTAVAGVAYPLYINFNHSFFEQESAGGVSQLYIANGGSGSVGPLVIEFDDCNFVNAATSTGPTIDVLGNSTTIKFRDPSISGSSIGCFQIADTCVVYMSDPIFVGAAGGSAAAILLQSVNAVLNISGDDRYPGTFTARYGGAHAAAYDALIINRVGNPMVVSRSSAADRVIAATYAGHVGWTYVDFANGYRWFYDGTTADTFIGPSNIPGAGGYFTNKGLGVWNHAAPATQPATPVTLADVIAALQAYGFVA